MKKENPYSIVKDTEHNPKDWYDTRYGAWEEGYHSRDLAVGKLVEVCSAVIVDQDEYGLITNHTLDLLEAVIAKAKP